MIVHPVDFVPPLLHCVTIIFDRYIKREFPHPKNGASAVYSVPKMFQKSGEKQASLAEQEVFEKLKGVDRGGNMGLWMTFFHSASYGGHSFRNQRVGKLMIREHDFVLFITYRGKTARVKSGGYYKQF